MINHHISATVLPNVTKFGMVMHIGLLNPNGCKEIGILKHPRWQTAAIFKTEKL